MHLTGDPSRRFEALVATPALPVLSFRTVTQLRVGGGCHGAVTPGTVRVLCVRKRLHRSTSINSEFGILDEVK